MDMKPGYKQTEVGVIPEGWSFRTMLEATSQIMDYRGRTPKKLGMEWGGEIPALSAGNVKPGYIDFSAECYFGSEELYRRWMTRGDVRKDDILFTTEAPLGNVALVPDERKYILSQRTILLKIDSTQADSRFLFQYMSSDGFQRVLADYSSGSTAKGIQRKQFEQLYVPVPPLPEQRAIASALSDVDGLLGALDRLIAKKRDLKQAAMQQLLTAQTRLPGFTGEWEDMTLQDICLKIQDGTHFSPKLGGNDYLYITSKNIRFGKLDLSTAEYISKIEHDKIYSRCDVKKGDVLLTKDGANTGNAALNSLATPFSLLSSVAMLRLSEKRHSASFFMYQILSVYGQAQIREAMSGNAITRLTLQKIKGFRFAVPSLPEQTAIAQVLSDMDADLAALEQRRDKTLAIKQGMMQQLLTGRTRLL